MSFIRTGASALGKLLTVGALAAAFFAGLVGVVYLSLRGEEVKVPELIGKDFSSSEKEMESLGLKLKRQATRYSEEKPNTVLEQLPKPGETVKTGQTILVVLSEANPEGDEAPVTIKKETDSDSDEDEGTDIAPDKPVNANKNSNVKKPSQTTRDVISNKSNKNTNSNSSNSNSDNTNSKSNSNNNKSSDNKNNSTEPSNKTTTPNKTTPTNKPTPGGTTKSDTPKPAVSKTPASNGETRNRKSP